MTKTEHKRKLIRLEWLMDKEIEVNSKVYDNKFNTKIYEDEVYALSNEIELFEEKEYFIPPPSPHELLLFHLDRTGLKKGVFAKRMGISPGWFGQILKGNKISIRMKKKIMNFNYQLL